MESVHGVDVSWLHRPQLGKDRGRSASSPIVTVPRPSTSPAVKDKITVATNLAPAPEPEPESPAKKRPGLLSRNSADDKSDKSKRGWMSSISSKFSSPDSPEVKRPGEPRTPEAEEPYVPQKPKESSASFFSSLSRRLSSNSPSTPSKTSPGALCARKVLNVDPNRQRCPMPGLKDKTLRKVAFSVDVEIAAQPRYQDDAIEPEAKPEVLKAAEAAEGAALKNPKTAAEDPTKITDKDPLQKVLGSKVEPEPVSHKKEKKKKSEEERKERKEKKRQKAEDSGSVPVEFVQEDARPRANSNAKKIRPTTDPVRIYRRCCQLRESPILKRITEQLMSPTCVVAGSQGTVAVLDLTGSRMQPPDVVTLADWLAVVPVKRLVLDDSDLDDEGVRVVLAGLLAAQTPQHSKCIKGEDQAKLGIVEKLSLKNNPRITAAGWNHISLFLYMCRSIKAIDLSMVPCHDESVDMMCKALQDRLAPTVLEEIILSECGLSAQSVKTLTDAMAACGISRLGLAGVELNDEAFESVLTYIRSDVCNALDIGSNDLQGRVERLAGALSHSSTCQLWGLSLASCNLDSSSLDVLLSTLATLPHFKFIDLSHNRNLCGDGIQVLRDHLPRLTHLRRLHLLDVGMNIQQAIALAEILPEAPSLAHVSLLENEALSASISKTDETSQEEACALFASLLAAVKVSPTIFCIDIDVPPNETCEVIKAMAKQVVAYCLRNMDSSDALPPDKEDDVVKADQDYIVGGTGLVKALQYCLASDDAKKGKAKEMSKGLLDSAREMRARLQPQLVKEATDGHEMAYRKLQFLESTLQGMIARFEDEYPETRTKVEAFEEEDPKELARRASDVSLASKVLSQEEGRLHRLSSSIRRDILAASPSRRASPTPEDAYMQDLRKRIEGLSGDELKELVDRDGFEGALEHIGANVEDLRALHESDPVAWEQFKESQIKARMNIKT